MSASSSHRHSSPTSTLVTVLVIAAFAAVVTAGAARAGQPNEQKTDLLFVLEGQRAWTEPGREDALKLTIADVDPEVLFFSDRPARNAGTVRSADLFDAWESLDFDDDPPNAAVVMQRGPKGRRPTAVELGAPRYDAAAASVTFPVSALNGQETSWLRALTEELAQSHGTIDLFVDTSPVDLRFVNDTATGVCVLVFQPPPHAKACKP